MAIRAYLTKWHEVDAGGLIYIRDAIDDHLDAASLSASIDTATYDARRGAGFRPDRLYRVRVLRGNLTQAEWDAIAALPDVRAIPNFRFDKQTNTIGASVKNKIYQALDALGIPRTAFDSSATLGGFLRNVLTELASDERGFGQWELLPDEWA